jgi:predicted NBD/HSP70 family sugar kinase
MSDEQTFVVMDAGGTTVRTARYRVGGGDERLAAVRRVTTHGIVRDPRADVARLQEAVVDQLVAEATTALGHGGAEAVAVAFAGPVTAAGEVLGAPTIWGAGGEPLPLAEILGDRLGLPVVVVNDLTAAVWRYVDGPDEPPFCLITVSSGIGNKVYWRGTVLLDDAGYGGELGHWRCDPDPAAPLCDCGGRGHLGAIASGRGMLAAARRTGRADPDAYARSVLGGADPDELSSEALAAAMRGGDPFALQVLRAGQRHLASAITTIYTSIGVRRFRIIGGFATAVGDRYAQELTACLREAGCFSLSASQVSAMVQLGHADDDHGLIGAGRLIARAALHRAVPRARTAAVV